MLLKKENCIFCGSSNIERFPAKMAPFIKARLNSSNDDVFNIIHCKNCGSAFYDYRYDEDEVLKIYDGYRNEQYQKTRRQYENWYSREINQLLGYDPRAIKSRNDNLSKIIKNNVNIRDIRVVLDFGGDTGQYIPSIFSNTKKYVYDISSKSVLEGISPLRSLEECYAAEPKGYDFIMCAHVFEHLSDPDEMIQTLKSLMGDKGYLYIEIPFDSPFYKTSLSNLQYLFNPYFKLTDLVKKYFEMKNAKYFLMHEHINFFTPEGIENLLKRNGFKIKYLSSHKIYSTIGLSKIISVLCSL